MIEKLIEEVPVNILYIVNLIVFLNLPQHPIIVFLINDKDVLEIV
jgi:hypothetical protein